MTPTTKDRLQLAIQHHSAGRLAEAEAIHRQILVEHPNEADALHLLGYLIHQSRRDPSALDLVRRAIAIEPRAFQYHNTFGLILLDRGQAPAAAEAFRRAIQINPGVSDAHNNLGSALQAQNQFDQAIAAYREAVRIKPDLTSAHFNIGSALTAKGDLPSAAAALRDTLRIDPRLARAHNNLGYVLYLQNLLDEAVAAFHEAVAHEPNYSAAWNNLGLAYRASDQPQQAADAFARAVALNPSYADAENNWGLALADLGRSAEAIAHQRRAISLRPDFARAHWALSQLLLLRDEYEEGFSHWDWRLKIPELGLKMSFSQPMWDGGNIAGRRIVLITEQGAGDAIQFARFIPLVAQRGGHVILACKEPLARLLQTAQGVQETFVEGQTIPGADLYCPLESLPKVFKTTFQTIPAQTPYLSVDSGDAERWKARMPDDKLKVGLVWSGKTIPNPKRSIPLSQLAPLGEIENIWWLSLQTGEAASQASSSPFPLTNWSDELKDFAATAALVSQLDLIITIDTAVAHLAGALGKRVWVMLPFVADWRWGLGRENCPWYPTMRLFRQPVAGDWGAVIKQIACAPFWNE